MFWENNPLIIYFSRFFFGSFTGEGNRVFGFSFKKRNKWKHPMMHWEQKIKKTFYSLSNVTVKSENDDANSFELGQHLFLMKRCFYKNIRK